MKFFAAIIGLISASFALSIGLVMFALALPVVLPIAAIGALFMLAALSPDKPVEVIHNHEKTAAQEALETAERELGSDADDLALAQRANEILAISKTAAGVRRSTPNPAQASA